jgi:TonB-dependent starch-binding outer membrane protein SusC
MKKNKPFRELLQSSLKKTLLIMRIATVLLILGILQAHAADAYSQKTRLSLKFSDTKLINVLDAIEKESEFFFLYNEKLLDTDRQVNINENDQSIDVILSDLFKGTDVRYTIIDRKIILAPDYLNKESKSGNVSQQQIVTGVVTDSQTGQSMPGVNIIIKGTTIGTITDANGKYSINVTDRNAVLIFSFIGYGTMEIPISGKTVIDAALTSESKALEEVVVIGYGTQKKSDLTGSVVRINVAGTEKAGNLGLLQAIQGTDPGINVSGGGLSGSEQDLSIRGRTSLSASDRPLIVVDGIIYNGAINDINIQDVESIDVLKDASAAAVYGSRSANGVLIITTKKGKTEKPLFNLNAYYGFQNMTNNPMKVMNGEQYANRLIDFYWESALYTWYKTMPTSDAGRPVRANSNDPNVVVSYLRSQEEKDNYLAGHTIDWIKEVMRKAPVQNYDLSVSGKTGRTNYYLSGSIVKQKGILLNDQFTRSTLHSNFENKITDWMTIGVTTSYSYRDYSGLECPLSAARTASPFANMFNSVGGYPMYLSGGELYQPHPLSNLIVDNLDLRNNLLNILSAKIDIPKIKGLTYDFNYSNTFNVTKNNTFYPSTVAAGSNNNGLATKVHTEERSWIFNNIVTYLRTFGTDHKINATLLYSKEYRRGETSNLQATGFSNPALIYNGLQLGTVPTVSSGAWEEKSLSYMGRLNYSFRNRYLLTGTIRKDGFSGFGPNKKFATFPSLSLGWVLSEESFLKSIDWLNFLKLRTSVGVNGNQGIGRYSSFSKMSTSAYVYNGITSVTVYPNTLGNADLGWESTLSYNVGLDYTVLNSRITGSIDLYKAQTSDVLVSRSIPGSTGYASVWTNIGGIGNKGIELSLTTVNIKSVLEWESRISFSLNRDKITKLYGGESDKDIGNSWFVGQPISAIYDYKMTGGVWTEQELYNKQIITGFYPGQFRLADLNGDGLIDPNNDRKIIGYRTPSYTFSINNSLSYKNFILSFFINSIQGGKDYYLADNSAVLMVSTTADHAYRENCTAVRQYWTPDNGVTDAPGIYNSPQRVAGLYQSRSFVRLQDVSLSYRFNPDLLKTLRIDGLQIYINGKNLYTWTKWSGWDPETASNTPLMRTIIGGIKLTF